MKKKNKIIESISTELLTRLPLTLQYVSSQEEARDIKNRIKYTPSLTVCVHQYGINNYEPHGFVKPISKIIVFFEN